MDDKSLTGSQSFREHIRIYPPHREYLLERCKPRAEDVVVAQLPRDDT